MPSKPAKPCKRRLCIGLVRDGVCSVCGTSGARERESAAERGYGRRWRLVSTHYRKRHPLCVECKRQGVLRAAEVVDHIRPHKGDRTLFWDANNWQSLCKRCHDAKTRREYAAGGESVPGG